MGHKALKQKASVHLVQCFHLFPTQPKSFHACFASLFWQDRHGPPNCVPSLTHTRRTGATPARAADIEADERLLAAQVEARLTLKSGGTSRMEVGYHDIAILWPAGEATAEQKG